MSNWDSRLICKYCKRQFATSDSLGTHLYQGFCMEQPRRVVMMRETGK
jgi:hypothetical protein